MIPRLVAEIWPCDGFCDGAAGGGQGHSSRLMTMVVASGTTSSIFLDLYVINDLHDTFGPKIELRCLLASFKSQRQNFGLNSEFFILSLTLFVINNFCQSLMTRNAKTYDNICKIIDNKI